MTVDADPGEQAQREAERTALRNVRRELDAVRHEEQKQRRMLRRTAIACGIVVVVAAAAFALFVADARERRAAAEAPLPSSLAPAARPNPR